MGPVYPRQFAAFCERCVRQPVGGDDDELVKLAYGQNYARLVEIKLKYDPKNVLRLNQNIKPN